MLQLCHDLTFRPCFPVSLCPCARAVLAVRHGACARVRSAGGAEPSSPTEPATWTITLDDEVPEGFQVPPNTPASQAIQNEAHPARVALYDLKSGEMLLRLHRPVDATIPAIPGDAETIEAQRRQILNCALAQEVRSALSK